MNPNASGTFAHLMDKDGLDFVQSCYREMLLREADPEGLASHLNALQNGASKATILASLANSDEACLNNMATSRLATAARRQAFLDRSNLVWPFRNLAATIISSRLKERMAARRGAMLSEMAHGTNAVQSPGSTISRPPVEAVRITHKDWLASLAANRALNRQGINPDAINTLWFDLTTTMQWTGGVVGIVRAELELACGLARIYPDLRFSLQIDQGFAEIERADLQWLIDADNITDAYMRFFARYKGATEPSQSISVCVPDVEGFFHPYEDGDAVISVGWMDSQKERYFSLAKRELPGLQLFYLIYDIILLLETTRHFYPIEGRQRFAGYVEWISRNCDLIFYGGQTARTDTQAWQREKGWPVPRGVPLKFGTDIVSAVGQDDDAEILEKLGVKGPFIITVGSLEPRKNHEILYRAYLMVLESMDRDPPQMIFIGKPAWRVDDILDTINRDPRVKGKLLCMTPTDIELSALYRNCRFTMLPSLYEGWSLTLPESLGQGKFCLCSDTPPLREIGGDLVDYVAPYDTRAWADKITLYSTDDALLKKYEEKIASRWPVMLWSDTARSLHDAIAAYRPMPVEEMVEDNPIVWMDLTLSYLDWAGGISGIVRAELEYARQLKALDHRTRFFAYQRAGQYFFEIKESNLLWLFEGGDLAVGYRNFQTFWSEHERNGTGYRDPFLYPGFDGVPNASNEAYFTALPSNSIVFFAGIDFDLSRVRGIDRFIVPERRVMKSQLIYDLTPMLTPQFHLASTCEGFRLMFEHVSHNFDHIVYGGRTALRDGEQYQREMRLPVPPSAFVEFGSNFGASEPAKRDVHDGAILKRLGLVDDFAITVGTIEPRKNHEVLYKAYLIMQQQQLLEHPFQVVFVGKKGWKADDFMASIEQDDRVRGRILIVSPSDDELDVLYRHCKFTLLPSFYEGWSLTLPESLSYGKLCLTSDVDPLRETGRDLVEYIHPLDTGRWAERIAFYANNPAALTSREAKIRSEWKARSWQESAVMLLEALREAHSQMEQPAKQTRTSGATA